MALGPGTILPLIFVLFVGHLITGLIVTGENSRGIIADKRLASDKSKTKDARKLYKQNCVKCHGTDGTGETTFGQIVGAADFTDSEWQKRVDDQRLLNSMTYGRGQMPSFGKKFSKEQIITLLAYVRAFKS
jgi:mono/diheme cytochrome c family protein